MPFILRESKRKGKRFEIIMPEYNHSHHFGSDVGKNYNSFHSGIFHSRNLLWSADTLEKAIRRYKKLFGIDIIDKTNI